MHSIYFTAVLTTAIAIAVLGTVMHQFQLPATGRLLWLAAVLVLPLEPLAFFFVRVPLDHGLVAQLGSTSAVYKWLVTLYAPLTEEPAKLVPLLIPAIRRDIRAETFVRYALVIGVSFAIGEMWFLAERVAGNPAFAGKPFYFFQGYFGERLMVCVFHSAFVALALWRWRRRFALGLAGAMTLHWLGNFPIFLKVWNIGSLGNAFWAAFIDCWSLVYLVATLALLIYLGSHRMVPPKAFYGRRNCPECGSDYAAPIFALNFGQTRYERCPHCRRWHWAKTRKA